MAPIISGYRDWAEAFPAPVYDRDESSEFCMSYSLSNQSTFGCYAPILNGVDRRPPWRVISLPDASDEGAEKRTKLEREKISGGEDRMEASGRGYGRLMGLTEHNGNSNGDREDPRWTANVQRGDTVRFEILKRRYNEDLYEDSYDNDGDEVDIQVSIEDLVNESESDRTAADDALQIGEEFMINASRFRVVDRDDEPFEMERDDVDGNGVKIELECIEDRDASSREIGFVSEEYFEKDIPKNDTAKYDIFEDQHVPPHWSPLLRYELASFRNIRAANVTEIGLRSRVYAQMNGMCNFPTIPTSNELRDQFDKQNITFTNGVQNQYFPRYSFFKLYMRSVDDIDPSNVSTFRDTKMVFAIKGNEPVDQYNYVRIKPRIAKQYEYRFYPLNSGWVSGADENETAWVLDTALGEEFTVRNSVGGLGDIEISAVGHLICIRDVLTSPLMLGKRSKEYDDNERAYCPPSPCNPQAPQDEWSGDCISSVGSYGGCNGGSGGSGGGGGNVEPSFVYPTLVMDARYMYSCGPFDFENRWHVPA
ncbi:MAG: hypothetical protein ACPF97_08310, partial [Ilumatobacteraceae bacterium]